MKAALATLLLAASMLACSPSAPHGPDVWALDQLPPLCCGGYIDEQTRATVEAYADSHPDVYAGRFLTGGHIYVGFTSDAAGNLAALRSKVGRQSEIRVFTADFTYRQLIALREQILHDRPWFKAQGIELRGWGPDDYTNREVIGLSRLDPLWMAEIIVRYGYRIVRFEQAAAAIAE